MIKSSPSNAQPSLSGIFSEAASPCADLPLSDKQNSVKKPSRTVPVSVRFTTEEKARLENNAADIALSEYIRRCVLADETQKRAKQHRKKKRSASTDTVMVAKLLGALGQSEMTQVLFSLLLAAKAGELDAIPHASEKLDTACDHIADMREMLIIALNVKPKGERA